MRTLLIILLLIPIVILGLSQRQPAFETGRIHTLGIAPEDRILFRPDADLVHRLFDDVLQGAAGQSWTMEAGGTIRRSADALSRRQARYLLHGSVERWKDRVLMTWYWEEAATGRVLHVHSALYDYERDAIPLLVARSLEAFRQGIVTDATYISKDAEPVAADCSPTGEAEVVYELKTR